MITISENTVKNKIQSINSISSILNRESVDKKIVLCHGVFDLLHIGHIRHFQCARNYGDILVVSLTPDIYVNKGPNSPAFNESLRAEALASLVLIDYVIINDSPTAINIIHKVKP